jgi:ABC-type transporter Mla subunit MlaD
MTEIVVFVVLGAAAAAVVVLIAARAGRRADRESNVRQAELEALSRIHERSRP